MADRVWEASGRALIAFDASRLARLSQRSVLVGLSGLAGQLHAAARLCFGAIVGQAGG
jgi:hypothetical protein